MEASICSVWQRMSAVTLLQFLKIKTCSMINQWFPTGLSLDGGIISDLWGERSAEQKLWVISGLLQEVNTLPPRYDAVWCWQPLKCGHSNQKSHLVRAFSSATNISSAYGYRLHHHEQIIKTEYSESTQPGFHFSQWSLAVSHVLIINEVSVKLD